MTLPLIFMVIFIKKKWSTECEMGKTTKIGHFGPFWAVLRPKYGWIQPDLDLKYLPQYIVSDFWLRSRWFQPKIWSTECQMGKNCPNRPFEAKYGWIQLDSDLKYLPVYNVSDFWVRSSWFQTKNWSTECQMGENCQNRPFWPVLSCFEALTLLDPSGSRLK